MFRVSGYSDHEAAAAAGDIAVLNVGSKVIFSSVVKVCWVFIRLIWPILKWVVSIDCVFQLGRTIYYWNTPGVYAGWTFLLHFGVLTALTYFITIFKPKKL